VLEGPWRLADRHTSIAIVIVALAIFVVDMLVHVDFAIPILYVAVVLMSVRLYGVRGVVIVSLGCILSTVGGYLLSPGNLFGTTAVANRFLALLAIGATTFLALKDRAAQVSLDKAQADLAHVTRVTTLGELTASIAHEVNQPLTAIIARGEACVRWLDREVPDLDEARGAVESIINDGKRAGEVIQRVRALAKKTDTERRPLDINDLVTEVIALVQRELLSNGVSLRIELVRALPMVLADRVQLQQVIINLVMNGIEAMQTVTDRPRTGDPIAPGRSTSSAGNSEGPGCRDLPPTTPTDCSAPSSPPNPAAWAWDSRSAVRSSKLTGDDYRALAMLGRVRRFNSLCRRADKPRPDPPASPMRGPNSRLLHCRYWRRLASMGKARP
jgi:signal transduction histidine kinase